MPTNLFAGNITGSGCLSLARLALGTQNWGRTGSGPEYVRGLSEPSAGHRHPIFHHLLTFLSENIMIFCFQSHGVLQTNFQESVCHGMGMTQRVSTGTLPNPRCSAGTKPWLQTRFCNPLPQSRMYRWGKKSGDLLRNTNIEKVFGF